MRPPATKSTPPRSGFQTLEKSASGNSNGWKPVRLEDVADINVRPKKDEFDDEMLVSFVPMKSVEAESGKFVPAEERPVGACRKGYTPFRNGDVLFAKVTPCMENGKAAVMKELTNGIGFGSTEFYALRPKDEIDSYYLYHFISQKNFRHEAERNMTGAVGLRRVPKTWMLEQKIPIPETIADQRRIVAEIEKQFTRLDAGVEGLKRVQANLKRYRASVLKAACSGELVPTEAELCRKDLTTEAQREQSSPNRCNSVSSVVKNDFESGAELLERILAERRKTHEEQQKTAKRKSKYKEPAAPDTKDLPDLPEGWTWTTVEQCSAPEINSITDGPFGSKLKTSHYTDSGPRVIRLQNIGDGNFKDVYAHISEEHFETLQKHRIFAGDVVIAGFGEDPPRSCVIPETLGPAIVKADCIRFKPHGSVMPKYMNFVLNSNPVRRRTKGMVHGVGRPRLNLGEIKSIVLPLPPLAEQKRIVEEVERRLSVIEEMEAAVEANIKRASRLRQSILKKAFSGGLIYQARSTRAEGE